MPPRLRSLRHTAESSEFARHSELIGSSLLFAFDGEKEDLGGVWMIDFGKTQESKAPLNHRVAWQVGNHEDGYMFGLDNLIDLWEELCFEDLPLDPEHWVLRAEGSDSAVVAYTGTDPRLQNGLLRLPKVPRTIPSDAGNGDGGGGEPGSSPRKPKPKPMPHAGLDPVERYHLFAKRVIRPLLGPAVETGRVIRLRPEFLSALVARIEPTRPSPHREATVVSLATEFALLMHDATLL
eukprot:RCo011142